MCNIFKVGATGLEPALKITWDASLGLFAIVAFLHYGNMGCEPNLASGQFRHAPISFYYFTISDSRE